MRNPEREILVQASGIVVADVLGSGGLMVECACDLSHLSRAQRRTMKPDKPPTPVF